MASDELSPGVRQALAEDVAAVGENPERVAAIETYNPPVEAADRAEMRELLNDPERFIRAVHEMRACTDCQTPSNGGRACSALHARVWTEINKNLMAQWTFSENIPHPLCDLASGVHSFQCTEPPPWGKLRKPPTASATPTRTVDMDALERIGRELLVAIGENPERPGLVGTPGRFARMWREFIQYEPGTLDTAFVMHATDQMVVVRGMRVWSMCEHHLLPFAAEVSIGYIAQGRVLGLSKFARVAHDVAHRLQIQEAMSEQIADRLEGLCGTDDVAVYLRGEHLCMTSRGIKTPATMVTSVTRGLFRSDERTRAEFLQMVHDDRPVLRGS